MKKTLLSLFGLCIAGAASAQIYITDVRFDPNGVNNDGIVVGSQDQNQPILLWDAKKGGDESAFTNIGGISAGQGIGGVARFSGDGKFVTAPMPYDAIMLVSTWQRGDYSDLAYKYNDLVFVSDYNLFAVGSTADGQEGVLIKSANKGVTWKKWMDGFTKQGEDGMYHAVTPSGLMTFAPLSNYQFLTGGKNGELWLTQNSGGGWEQIDLQPADDEATVETYQAIDFMYGVDEYGITSETAKYGVIGVKYDDGTYAVWSTEDEADSFSKSEGVSGVPVHITHGGNVFFMVTENGHIQKSVDYGKTWTDVFATKDGSPLYRIKFADAQKGIATADAYVYITKDGGETWTQTEVTSGAPSIGIDVEAITWNDAAWSGDNIFVVGTGGNVYQSVDNGETFEKVEVETEEGVENIYTVVDYNSASCNILAEEGRFYNKSDNATAEGYCGGIYDIENETWTPLASSGYMSGYAGCSPWHFSGDGKTVVGNADFMSSLTNTVQAHAAAMSPETMIDLGSKFDNINRASSALGVSYDASVIVGWQDIFGPRFGAVWTRNEDGSYTQRMMLKDTSKDEDDINYDDKQDCYDNLVATARSVSPDGKWIGGDGSVGDSAFPGPWLWNEEEGYKLIFDDAEVDGGVAAVSNNGEKAVGWQGLNSSAWLYTKDGGVQLLQDYVTNVLGCDLGDFFIGSVYDMSPNGRYVTGYGMRGDQVLGYMIDLEGKGTSIEDKVVSQTKASVYPNPVSDELHIDLPYGTEDVKTTLTLVDMQGCAVRRVETVQTSNIINVSNLPQGIYILDVNARGSHKAFKVVIKH